MTAPLPASPAGVLADSSRVRYDAAGLVPVVVQDAGDGRVLMLAWASAEAVAATLATGDVHFYSRSRSALWRKGETSGNTLRLVDLALDCDGDALLARVVAQGPTCHRLERSCFDPDGAAGRVPPLPLPAAGSARGSAGSRPCGPRSPTARPGDPRARTRPGCSPPGSMDLPARWRRRRPRS